MFIVYRNKDHSNQVTDKEESGKTPIKTKLPNNENAEPRFSPDANSNSILNASENGNIVSVLNDPCPMFSGKKLTNTNGYSCYLNSIINGLLSIRYFRELIPFMDKYIKDIFMNLLKVR